MPRRDSKQIAKTLATRAQKMLADLRSDDESEASPPAPRPRTFAKEAGRTITISTPAAKPPVPSSPADAGGKAVSTDPADVAPPPTPQDDTSGIDSGDEAQVAPSDERPDDDAPVAPPVAVAAMPPLAPESQPAPPPPPAVTATTTARPTVDPEATADANAPHRLAESSSDRRRRIALLTIVLLLIAGVIAAIIVSVTGGNETIEADAVLDTIEGEEPVAEVAEPTTDSNAPADADTAEPATDAGAPDTGADPESIATAEPAAGTDAEVGDRDAVANVPESRAIVSDGKIVLEGAVPTREAADGVVALAEEILGPDNVVDNYVIDPRAGDPNLGSIRVDDPVLFQPGSATVAADFEPLLRQALTLMTLRPSVTMTIVGHTDDVGGDQDRQLLSLQRAQAVERWLIDHGVDRDRLTALGRGDTEPIAPNDTAQGRQLNRRIQVFIENLLVDG